MSKKLKVGPTPENGNHKIQKSPILSCVDDDVFNFEIHLIFNNLNRTERTSLFFSSLYLFVLVFISLTVLSKNVYFNMCV